jgi:hypothetical protein
MAVAWQQGSDVKQSLGVGARNCDAVCFADSAMIEPVPCHARILKWIIDGVQHPVGADFHYDFGECLRMEIAAGRYEEVLSQIVAFRRPAGSIVGRT